MRKLIYCVATSLDGFIADEKGSPDGFPFDESYLGVLLELFPETLPAPFHAEGITFDNEKFDAVLMGKATYDVGASAGITNPYPTLDQYVFSRSMTESPDPAVTLVSKGAIGCVEELKKQDGKDIWLCGGAQLAGTLFKAGLIDEMIVKLNPVLFGTGIPLFTPSVELTQLELTSSMTCESGHEILYYTIRT